MITVPSNHVAHGRRVCGAVSNSTGTPRKAAICFHDSSGGTLSRSEPSASLPNRSTSAIASISRAFCGSSGAGVCGRCGTSVSTSCVSNHTKWQRRQTSTLIWARSDKATSIIGCRHDGQGAPLRPSPRMACSHNGLIDSGVKRLRNSSIVAARPPQLSHAQKTLPEVRTSFNGSSQRGQMSAVSVVIGYGLHSQ